MTDKAIKKFKLKPGQIVFIVIATLICAIMITIDFLADRYSAIISTFLGTAEKLEEGDSGKVEESAKSGDEVVRNIANEGVVLLKNDGILPLKGKKVNIFGWGATDAGFLLVGNGSGRSYVHPDNRVGFLKAFTDNGFEYNQEIIDIYENWRKSEDKDWGEAADWGNRYNTKLKEPVTANAFSQDVISRATEFSDTAVVVLSRYSGEFIGRLSTKQLKYNLPTDETRGFGEISTEEESLIKMCTSRFDKVIIVFNTGSIMDMTFLDDEANFGKIGAALNVGYMGQSGTTAIPKILSGEVNPSGKLADTVVYNPKENEIARINADSSDLVYIEDIYLGYKYYETANVEGYYNGKTLFGKSGYDAVVQYPFGHGLSYTTFAWEVESLSLEDGATLEKDSEIELKVKVTNTGSVAGKDVVQLYSTPEYFKGGIEKAHVNLIDFQKTPMLYPVSEANGDDKLNSATVTFKLTPYELASYDCYDKNESGTTGWELDIGKVELKLMTDAHNLKQMDKNTITYHVRDMIIRYRKDPETNGRIRNRFTGDFAYGDCALDGSTLGLDWKYLTRADFKNTVPTSRSGGVTSKLLAPYADYQYDMYDYSAMPTTGKDAKLRLVVKDDGSFADIDVLDGTTTGVKLKYNDELIFKLGDPEYWDDDIWDTFLDQLTPKDLRTLVEDSGYGSRAIESIGKITWWDYDGPSGFNRTNLSPNVKGSKMTAFPAENLVGQCWNKELLYQAGQIIGMDGQNFGISGIYAPCINLHREAINGRNYECYSEDPILSGYYAANFVIGAKSNGVYTYLKHLALYDSSPYTNQRVWCTEQNFRENYLKPFEIAIKKGGATGVMASFNKIGPMWAGANQAMIDGVLRTEFGFKGTVVTDYDDGTDSNMKIRAGLRAGLNTQLNPQYGKAASNGRIDMDDVVDMNLARESAKSIVYTSCNAYNYAKNLAEKGQYSIEIEGPKVNQQQFRWWILIVVFINVISFGLLIWWGLMCFLPRRKKAKASANADGGGGDGDNADISSIECNVAESGAETSVADSAPPTMTEAVEPPEPDTADTPTEEAAPGSTSEQTTEIRKKSSTKHRKKSEDPKE